MKARLAAILFFFVAMLGVATPAAASLCSVGDRADVLWKGKWYPASVLSVNRDGTKCFIRYTGYGSNWDEWVGGDRYRGIYRSSRAGFSPGDSVDVRWKGRWYAASVLRTDGDKYYIHYDGYASSWDEWVGPHRIRAR